MGQRRRVLAASVTPLASIFGSGFLIIVPVLERTLGALAVVGAAGVCAVAWLVGTAIRHCVRVVEPLAAAGTLDATTRRIDRAADAVIVVAYVISVALYLRIMAEYVVAAFDAGGAPATEKLVAIAVVIGLVSVGIARGFHGLDLLDRAGLGAVLLLTTLMGATLLLHGGRDLADGGIELPPIPDLGLLHVLLVLGGIVITVQGFETVRYLGQEFDGPTRIAASRVSQLIATSIYLAFVALATPQMGLGTAAGADDTLLQITDRVAPWLAIPLVVCAVLSQFSAATADTAAAEGNLRGISARLDGRRSYVITGVAAVAIVAALPLFTIVAVASRAFAAYYGLQALVALRTCDGRARQGGYGLLALAMFLIAGFAQPAG